MTAEHSVVVQIVILIALCALPILASFLVVAVILKVIEEIETFWRDFWRAYYRRIK